MASRRGTYLKTAGRAAIVVAAGLILGGCDEQRGGAGSYRAYQPIPSDALAQMQKIGTDAHQPILIRAFKKEAELEIWKMRADGEYALFKTYPMCRWSGQLGPKRREGDRQVPEGFYTITQGQLNPNSAYYLSFNVGYPNAYDKAHGYTGGSIMVHGDCSSAGCFSMTDEQIAEIYAVAREAFGGGQRAIQMQSLPFRMNAENLAKHRFDPNMRFWKQLKEGVDQFDVTKRETKVAICAQKYVFGATPADASARLDAALQCPPMNDDPGLKSAVADKQRQDETKVAQLVASGVKAVKLVYADGGQHPAFAESVTMLSRPEAAAKPPTEIAINEQGKPIPAVVQVAAAKAAPAKPAIPSAVAAAKTAAPEASKIAVARIAPVSVASTTSAFTATASADTPADKPFYKRWIGAGLGAVGLGGSEPAPAAPAAGSLEQLLPTGSVPAPPRRQAQTPAKPQASPRQPPKPDGQRAALPGNHSAYAPVDHH